MFGERACEELRTISAFWAQWRTSKVAEHLKRVAGDTFQIFPNPKKQFRLTEGSCFVMGEQGIANRQAMPVTAIMIHPMIILN